MKVRPFVTVEPNLRRVFTQVYDRKKIRNPPQGKRFAANVICFRFFGFVVQKGRGRGGDRLGRPIECATAERAGPGAALAARLPPPPPAHVARHRGLLQLHGLLPIGPYQTRTNKKKTLLSHLLSCRRAVLLYIARILTSMSNFFFIENILLEMAPVICGRNCGCKTFLFRFFFNIRNGK